MNQSEIENIYNGKLNPESDLFSAADRLTDPAEIREFIADYLKSQPFLVDAFRVGDTSKDIAGLNYMQKTALAKNLKEFIGMHLNSRPDLQQVWYDALSELELDPSS